MRTIFLKSLLNLLQYLFCFMFWFFGHEACGILALWPGIEPVPWALEDEVLTTGLPGKSLYYIFKKFMLVLLLTSWDPSQDVPPITLLRILQQAIHSHSKKEGIIRSLILIESQCYRNSDIPLIRLYSHFLTQKHPN